MPLSFKEKNKIKKAIGENLKSLDTEGITFKEKNKFKKEIGLLLKKLDESLSNKPEGIENEKLKALIAGKYNRETPEAFLKIVKEIIDGINKVKPVVKPTETYIDLKVKSGDLVLEDAEQMKANLATLEA